MDSCHSWLRRWMAFQVKCSHCLTSRWQFWTKCNLFTRGLNKFPLHLHYCPKQTVFSPTSEAQAFRAHVLGMIKRKEKGTGSPLQVQTPWSFTASTHKLWALSVSWGRLTSLECVLFWCLARSEAFEKALLQPSCSQTYGFSPVWDLKCVFKFSSLE